MALQRGRCRLSEHLGNLSPAEFARRMKVTNSAVSRWLTGERMMSYENAVLASRILECHAEDLYEFIVVPKGKRQ